MKICGQCKVGKPLDEYHRNAASKDGRTSDCKECAKARARAWSAANRDRANKKSREWQQANRPRRKQYMKDYYAAHRDELIAANIKWNRDHPDVVRAVNAEYRKRVRENRDVKLKQVIQTARANARRRGFKCDMTVELLDTFIKIQNERCALTGIPFDYSCDDEMRVRPFAPSLDRRDNALGYTFDNVQVTCAMVNRAKNECPQEMFDLMCRARVEQLNARS